MSEKSEQNAPARCSCCTCGYTWVKGQHGGHSCAIELQARLAESGRRVAELEAQGSGFEAGVKAASNRVQLLIDDYDRRHGGTDPDTGTREYPGNGEEWVGQMLELIEDFTGIVPPKELEARQREHKPAQVMGRVHHNPDHAEPVRAVLNSIGRSLPDHAALYAAPPVSPEVAGLVEALRDLVSASRSVNRGRHFEVKGVQDTAPCYWQRKEWVDWLMSIGEQGAEALAAYEQQAGGAE